MKSNFLSMGRLMLVVLCLGFFISVQVNAQDLYSGGSGSYASITWYTNPGRTVVYGLTPGLTNTLHIGNGHNVLVGSGTAVSFQGIEVNDNGVGGTFTIGTVNDITATVTVVNDLIINAGGTVTAGGNNSGAVTHVLNISGDLTNNGTLNTSLNANDRIDLVFTGTGDKTVSGTGTFTILVMRASTLLGANININTSLTILSNINFTADGLFIVNATSNIRLGSGATITGFNSNRYIQLDGTTGSGSQLIVTSSGTAASWGIVYPIGTPSGGYTQVDLAGAITGTAPTAGALIAIKAIYNISAPGQMRRQFRIAVSGNAAATTITNGDFYYNTSTDISGGDVQANYDRLWFLSTASGTWVNVTGTAPGTNAFISPGTAQSLGNGTYFYAIGNSTAFTNVWYSYQSGVWSDPDVWTLDPSGTSLINPLNQAPLTGDEAVILNGFTVTSDISNITLSATTIQGGAILDLGATINHNLGTVTGSGLLRIKSLNLPTGNYAAFVLTTGGTIEYYDIGGTSTLSTTQVTYNKLKFTNSTAVNTTYIMNSNLTVNGTFEITATGSGTAIWQINSDAAANQRTITLYDDLTISANGGITVGNGNEGTGTTQPHIMTMYGNLINNGGVVKFYDPDDTELPEANYGNTTTGTNNIYTNEVQGNAVNVTFSGPTSKTIICNGVTDFYRLTVNKGTGRQSVLTINSSAAGNFRLFGPANLFSSGTQPNVISNCALSIVNGTLELTGTINIPALIVDGSAGAPTDVFSIPQNGALWLNSSTVTVTVADQDTGNDDQRLQVNGLLRVTNGTLNCGYSRGIGSYTGGIIQVEGGTVNMRQYRPVLGGSNVFVYIQTGGTVNVGTTGYNGTPVINGVTDFVTDQFARFSLPTTTSSFQMSGGILNIGTPSPNTTLAGAQGIDIQSSSANYNVTGGTINAYIPSTGSTFGISTTAPLYNLNVHREGTAATVTATLRLATTILNDLTLVSANGPTLNCQGNALTVGGNLTGQAGTTLTPGANTITFNGSGAQAWTHSGTITSLENVVLNKSAGTLTLGGTQVFPAIAGATTGLTLTSGTLADGGKTITVSGAISNSATHSGAGSIIVSNATTIGGANGTFGNLTITRNGTVATSGAQTVTGTLSLNNATSTILNISSYPLTVLGNITAAGALGTNYRIQTSGLHNSGGLTRQGVSGNLLFPVGTGTAGYLYTPVTINVTATTQGLLTVRPVNGEHPIVTNSNHSIPFYWRVSSTGYSTPTAVSHVLYNYSTAATLGTLAAYMPGRYDPNTLSWSTTTPIFNGGTQTTMGPFSFGVNIDGEYTAGDILAFGSTTIFYSRTSGSWNVNTTWSNTPCTGAGVCGAALPAGTTAGVNFPGPNNPVIIGDENNGHTVTIDQSSRRCGTLSLSATSVLDCGPHTSLDFGVSTGGSVTGTGRVRVSTTGSPAQFPGGDFTNFLGPNGGTVEWYGNSKSLPTSTADVSLASYHNLVLNPSAGQTITLPSTNLTIYNNWTQTGAGSVVSQNVARTYIVNGDLAINAGDFTLNNATLANSLVMTVGGNVSVATGATFGVPAAAGGTAVNTIAVGGSITNNGTMRFRNGNAVDITFTGTTNTTFGGTGTVAAAPNGTTLNRITVNKGTSQTPIVDFTVGGTVTAALSGWLTLTNGTFNFNNSGTFTISSASATYTIPSTAKLRVSSGTVTVLSAASGAADLVLNGAIHVSGGTMNIGNPAQTTDNDIEYAAAGLPAITVDGGSLSVNGAIRRSGSTLSGALVYTQSAGAVILAGRNPTDSRGIFEIDDNAGSSFTFTGGTLTIERPNDGTGSYADLYLNPSTSSVSTGATIAIGIASATQNFRLNVEPTLGNLTLLGTANAQVSTLYSNNLILGGTLTINSNATLNTNSLDVFIGGNLAGTGTYNGSNNTTTFNGNGAQSGALTASSSFLNMTVNKPTGTLTLSGTSPTVTNLNILNGVLDVGALSLTVVGNIVNNSSQIGTGAISMAGGIGVTSHTITSSGGSFTNLTLAGSATTKTVTASGTMTVNGTLNFSTTNRYLNIGSGLLTFGTAAAITGAGNTAFIKTNGSASDLGVTKNWAVGTASFNYAIGTRTNYTPVAFNNLAVTTAGELNVVPVDDRHPTANTAFTENILNYYWIVNRGAIVYGNNGTTTFSYPTSLLGGSGGTLAAGYLDIISTTPGWATSTNTAVTPGGAATTTVMTWQNFRNVNLPTAGNTFHYSVGTANTLPNPIIPVYSRRSDANVNNMNVGGDWNDPNSWTLTPGGFGPPWGQIPFGNSVVIVANSRINIAQSGRISFITQIDGLLVLPSDKVGHNLGILRGTGTMRMPINTFPAGNYNSYVASTGGTIEYVAPMTMNNRATYNNLSVIGTGGVIMTNTDLVLNGSISIASGSILNNTVNNRNITMAGNWTTTTGGSFNAGTGTVTFNGTGAASVNGTTTFNNVAINKTGANVTLAGTGTTTVNNTFTLTSGNLVTSATHMLSLPLAAVLSGGSASSFISGPVRKVLAAGGTFNMPLGSVSASRYRPATISNTTSVDTWTSEYVGADPTSGGYSNTTFNTANIKKVSMFEYWLISRAGATTADVTLTYNTGSYIPNPTNIGNVANLRVVRWDGTQWDLPPGSGTHSQSGTNVTGTVMVTNVTNFSPLTFGSLDADSPLPVKWGPFEARWAGEGVALRWVTIQEINNDHFEIERSDDGVEFHAIGLQAGQGNSSVQNEYRYFDSEASKSRYHYYRIKQIDYDGKFDYSRVIVVAPIGEGGRFWVTYPNPLEQENTFVLEQSETSSKDSNVDVILYSSQGIQVYQANGSIGEISKMLNSKLHASGSGMYLLKVSNGLITETFKIVTH
jgi:fibronectin-binding autotransporter adhesin